MERNCMTCTYQFVKFNVGPCKDCCTTKTRPRWEPKWGYKYGCKVVTESWCRSLNMPEIQNVIFNDPATIVFWSDGTKTIVKAQEGDVFNPEKGLAMAISKKALGNKHDYFE